MFPFVALVAILSIVVVAVVAMPVADAGIVFAVCFHAEMNHFLVNAFGTMHAVYPDVFAASMVLIFPFD